MTRAVNFLQLMQLTTHAIRMFVPWILRITLFMVSFIVVSIISFWSNVPQTVSGIANEWLDRATLAGFPTRWDSRLYRVYYVLAFGMIVLGWIVLSYLTIWIVGLIFHH